MAQWYGNDLPFQLLGLNSFPDRITDYVSLSNEIDEVTLVGIRTILRQNFRACRNSTVALLCCRSKRANRHCHTINF